MDFFFNLIAHKALNKIAVWNMFAHALNHIQTHYQYDTVNHTRIPHLLNVCLFVRDFIVTLDNFSLIWRRHHHRWWAANFDLCSALMAIEQWGIFNVQHPLWHGPSVYNGHLRGPVTLRRIAERLAVELLQHVLTTKFVAPGIPTPNLPLAGTTL